MLVNGLSLQPSSDSGEVPTAVSGVHALMPQGVRVLVVDDDPRVRRAVAGGLTRVGFHVVTADDGGPAILQAQATPPDLALVDLGMPTSGLIVVRHLKKVQGQSVHVTVLSGRDDEATRLAAFDAGADDFLVKPLSVAELRKRLIAAARSQQAYVEARLAGERADRLLAYGSEAAALLAHDLNNGLAVALSNITYLSEVLNVGDDEQQAIASTLRALRRMSGLVANFVDISRFEDAAVKPRCAPVDLRELLLDVAAVHGPSIGRGVRHEVVCDPALRGSFDAALIERVLHNLVGNAVRYCNANGKILLEARTWEREDDLPGVEIIVQNTGPAIPAETAQNLFSKYGKGSNGKRGMGLYFCRLACEAHGGAIEHETREDGPAFLIRLPGQSA